MLLLFLVGAASSLLSFLFCLLLFQDLPAWEHWPYVIQLIVTGFKKYEIIDVKILEIKDDKIRFSRRALEKDPLSWFKDNNKRVGDVITSWIHEVLKTGVKVSIDKDKKLIVTIKKVDLAKDSADARPEVFSPGNALDAKITELDLKLRKIKLSVKAAQIDEEKSLIAKFGEGATKSGATLKGIFEKAIGKKTKKDK